MNPNEMLGMLWDVTGPSSKSHCTLLNNGVFLVGNSE